jgi:signal transduction histidine kinase
MRLASGRDWRTRGGLILSGITLVLGVVLVTLAVREAEREKLSRERELDRERQRYGILVAGEADALFTGIENRLAAVLENSPETPSFQELSDLARTGAENDDLIGDVFIAGPGRGPVFPLRESGLSKIEKGRVLEARLKRIEGTDLFKTAEAAEFKTKDLPLAIRSYRALMAEAPDGPSRALIYNRLARCLLKSGDATGALRAYDALLEKYSDESSSEGIPLGIIALFQKAAIVRKTDPEMAGEIILEFYARLAAPEWTLDKFQYQYYRNLAGETAGTWKAEIRNDAAVQDFERRWRELDTRAEATLGELTAEEDLATKVLPLVEARLSESQAGAGKFARFSETIGEGLFLISAIPLRGGKILGLLIDDHVLLEERLPSILKRVLIPTEWVVQIADSGGRILFGEEVPESGGDSLRSPLAVPFNQSFPPWRIRIVRRDPESASGAYRTRRNTYILVAMAMTAVLFLGGFTVLRSTAKELELARLKSEFVSTVSHEFRTPLMSIRYLSEMLDTDRVRDEAKKKTYYRKISKESERLSRLVENMLDFSKIEAGMKKYRREEFSVNDLIADVAARFREYAGDKEMSLECETQDGMPVIQADREAISRALFNLLDNAMKYSGTDPRVVLSARIDGDAACLEVQDNGPGIRKEERRKVFEKFYRSQRPEHADIEGSGIGLTLVDHVARAHGGDVKIENAPGGGTKVTLRLPLSLKGTNHG